MNWQLADAKNRFSEVVRRALSEGPQRVTRRDEAVVIISEQAFRELTGEKPGLLDYLRTGPAIHELDLARDPDPMRDVPL